MTQRKPWTITEDQQLAELIESERFGTGEKLSWGDISRQLQSNGSKRSGKQCRQRWFNQLRPGIDNERGWSNEQQKILFTEQEQHGNRWCLIVKALPGRSENNIKNYFYCTLRKALRRVNNYVTNSKKEQRYRNVKQFKPQNLSKILIVAQKKYQQKINLTSSEVIQDAIKIKKLLTQIILSQSSEGCHQRCELLQQTVNQILQFNRNCKRRKGKKKDERQSKQQFSDFECHTKQIKNQDSLLLSQKRGNKDKVCPNKKKKEQSKTSNINQKKDIGINIDQQSVLNVLDKDIFLCDDKNVEMLNEKTLDDVPKKIIENNCIRKSSLGENHLSVLERSPPGRYHAGFIGNYQYSKDQIQGLNILDSIMPIYEATKAQDYNGTTFFKSAQTTLNNSIFLDQSRGYNIFEDESLRMSGIFTSQFQVSRKFTSYGQKPYDNQIQ